MNLTGRAGITEKYIKTDLKAEAPVKKSTPSQNVAGKKGDKKEDSDDELSQSDSGSDSEPELPKSGKRGRGKEQ